MSSSCPAKQGYLAGQEKDRTDVKNNIYLINKKNQIFYSSNY